MAPVTINGNTVELAQSAASSGYFPSDASETNYILVQFSQPRTTAAYEELARHGVRIQRVEEKDTLLCRYEPSDLEVLRRLPYVAHVSVYHGDFVVHPSVWDAVNAAPLDRSTETEAGGNTDPAIAIAIVLHESCGQHGEDVWQTIQSQIDPSAELIDASLPQVRARVKGTTLSQIASMDSVRSINRVRRFEFHTAQAYPTIAQLGEPWTTENNTVFKGRGEVVAVADSGCGGHDPPSVGFEDRVVGRVNLTDTPARNHPSMLWDWDGHGTHVAGCVLGKYTRPTIPNAFLPSYKRRCKTMNGPATEAGLFSIRIVGPPPSGNLVPDLATLFDTPYMLADGTPRLARVHNNSWGSSSVASSIVLVQAYGDNDAGLVDRAMSNEAELLIVMSSGNDGSKKTQSVANSGGPYQYSQVNESRLAKNSLIVGATFNNRSMTRLNAAGRARWADQRLADAAVQEATCCDGTFNISPFGTIGFPRSPSRVLAFSSKGPTPEGRIKPDVVAPGAGILSATTTHPSRTLPNDAYGVCPYPELCFCSGTSMAAPLVSGLAACVREALRTKGPVHAIAGPIPNPSGALVKALLINGAVDLVGSAYEYVDYTAAPGDERRTVGLMPPSPNGTQGFGRVNLNRSLVSLTEDGGIFLGEAAVNAGNPLPQQTAEQSVTLPTSIARSSLRVTLTWTDPPGAQLQNSLSLAVRCTDGSGAAHIFPADIPTRCPWEINPIPFAANSNTQRATIGNAHNYQQGINITVNINSPIQPYNIPPPRGGNGPVVHRATQPFAVVWAFDAS
ncbi:hypothetical protein BAUCODRAFT_20506 [Baudoinia panamericana UAMH 10762]|uniref:Peptidase S8/S53 domain-containing protein n=1 Tax=Baudoinia panamericana (strain UAMH 10762) TaxID=717646 RepID=M2MTZ0_BAUPA|nr:uncharacterized protein BAUCODRAFT_20506 [Baudoinia panamericana UAMH 10762]EMD00392.1 hypothetical protein BAUCODRAFT_20506 [Baudoinia panamericana UAMH 10762]